MKIKILVLAALCASGYAAQAITNTAIAVSGANIVLSWPSYGYENYLVQYRHTLDPSDSWSDYTNAYPANSTNRTTLTLPGLATSSSMSLASDNQALTAMAAGAIGNMAESEPALPPMPLAIPKDGSSAGVPVCIYPQGFDLSNFVILDPATGEEVDGALYSKARALDSSNLLFNGPEPLDGGGGGTGSPTPEPETGFYRVFHIPTFRANFSGYTFVGPTFIPVDYSSPDAPVDHVENTTVLIGGQPTDYAEFIPYVISGVTNWGVAVYFDRMPNGTNTIQLLTTVRQSDTLNDQTPYMVFSNAPATITIGNLVTYTNWSDLILSNTYTFKAQSSVANVDWEIDIYDAYDNFVDYQTGHSDDGNISWVWNLVDYYGNPRLDDSDPFFFPYITITGNLGNSVQNSGMQANANSSSGSWMPTFANQFPIEGAWLIGYLDNYYTDGTSNYADANTYYLPAIQNLEGGPLLWGTVTYDAPIKYGKSYSQSDRNGSWDSLRDDVQGWNARNFYYFGHGSANSIGGDLNVLDSSNNIIASTNLPGSKAYITSKWVHDNVTFNKSYGAMPFRFVFLDGCNTASGDWPQAWGIPKQSETLNYYTSASNTMGARPSAFLGWDVTVGGQGWGTGDKFWAFRTAWMAQWSVSYTGNPLSTALNQARDLSGWVPDQVNAHLKKYGFTDMGFKQYNQAGDWP